MNLHVTDLGIATQPSVGPCLSLSARFFRLDCNSEVTPNMIDRLPSELKRLIFGNEQPKPVFRYYGICFGLSLHEYQMSRHFLAPYRAELQVSLSGGYKAVDGAPIHERDLHVSRVKYTYGSKMESNSKLQFKLGWESKDAPPNASALGGLGETLSNDYSVVLETEVSVEFSTAQYINPFTSVPGWVFDRRPNQMVLKDTRFVWLMVERPAAASEPLKGEASLKALFRKVRENEKTIEPISGAQQRFLQKVAFERARLFLQKEQFTEPLSIAFDLSGQ